MDHRIYEVDLSKLEEVQEKLFRRQYEKTLNMSALVQQFTEERRKQGLTQGELASKVGTTQSAISRFETAYRGATIDLTTRIAKALDVNLTLA